MKRTFLLLFMLFSFFTVNMIVKADSYCNYKTKTDCENHNKKTGENWDYYCEWRDIDGKKTCAVNCLKLGKTTCNSYKVCRYVGEKCRYFGTSDSSANPIVDVGSEKCEDRTESSYCLIRGDCRWTGSSCITASGSNVSSEEDDSSIYIVDDPTYINYDEKNVSCGGTKNPLISGIPSGIPKLTHIVYLTIEIAVPVVLIILGMLDLFKGIYAQKEDEIKKGQQIFAKRLISAVLIFFVMVIVKILIDFVGDSKSAKIISCVDCFINNNCN